jgi:hypothetical protein
MNAQTETTEHGEGIEEYLPRPKTQKLSTSQVEVPDNFPTDLKQAFELLTALQPASKLSTDAPQHLKLVRLRKHVFDL